MPTNRKTTVSKPANAKANAKADATTATGADAKPAVYRGEARDASTIAAKRTHFGAVTDRDEAYLAMLHATGNGNPVTLSAVFEKHGKTNPFYTGSAKSTDAGAFVRLEKAGFITFDADARAVAFANAEAKATAKACHTKRS